MSRDIASKRHMCHHPTVSAEYAMTDEVTDDTLIRHPSPYVSPQKPLDHAEGDTYDTSEPNTGVTPEKRQETSSLMKKKKKRIFRITRTAWKEKDGTESPALKISAGFGHIIIKHEFARDLVDAVHDKCDEIDTEMREATREAR